MTPQDLISQSPRLATLPQAFITILSVLDSPVSGAEEIADALGTDTALASRLLQLANSAYYSARRKISSLQQAVSLVGLRKLRNLVLGAAVMEAFRDLNPAFISLSRFWRHSLHCASVARELALPVEGLDADSAFLAGLVHDVGVLVICDQLPHYAREIILMSDAMQCSTIEAERELLKFDHADLGGALLENWQFPADIVTACSHHHPTLETQSQDLLSHCVALANLAAAEQWHQPVVRPESTGEQDALARLLKTFPGEPLLAIQIGNANAANMTAWVSSTGDR
ncbi:MAG: HDOD domain-containing protein [Chromatiales bacterium]|nr:HDOD domain-containing protein [Chromatiales bacterium]